jgi:hypothetical protein
MLDENKLTICLETALKFNQPRVSFLLYKFSKIHMNIIKNPKIHRALIKAIIEYPENLEIYLHIVKRLIKFYSVPNLM